MKIFEMTDAGFESSVFGASDMSSEIRCAVYPS